MTELPFVLEGAPNFRDLGGYHAAGGSRVRSGRIFRSESLARLTQSDVTKIASLNIELLYDLRNRDERIRDPNCWQPDNGSETLAGQDSDNLAAVRFFGWRERIADPAFDAESALRWMQSAYHAMPRLFAELLASAIDRLSRPSSPVTLLHCSAGKDRTGFVCAMLLFALGVSREEVIEEYLLTRLRRPPEDLLQALLGQELGTLSPRNYSALMVMADVHEDYIGTALRAIEYEFGSVGTYLALACRMSSAQRDCLKMQLLE